jgi:hypothetical protein
MEYKKVSVASIDTRKVVEALLYLGSIGGELTKNCVAIKGLMLRADVELPWDVPVEESMIIKVSKGAKIVREEETPKKEVEAPKKPGRKPKEAVEEVIPSEG